MPWHHVVVKVSTDVMVNVTMFSIINESSMSPRTSTETQPTQSCVAVSSSEKVRKTPARMMSQAWVWHCRGWWWRPPSRDAGLGPRPDGNKSVHVSNPYTRPEISPNLWAYHKWCIYEWEAHIFAYFVDLLRDWKALQFTEAVQYTNWLCQFQENSRKLKNVFTKKCCTAAQLSSPFWPMILQNKALSTCDLSVYVVHVTERWLSFPSQIVLDLRM